MAVTSAVTLHRYWRQWVGAGSRLGGVGLKLEGGRFADAMLFLKLGQDRQPCFDFGQALTSVANAFPLHMLARGLLHDTGAGRLASIECSWRLDAVSPTTIVLIACGSCSVSFTDCQPVKREISQASRSNAGKFGDCGCGAHTLLWWWWRSRWCCRLWRRWWRRW